MTKSKSPVKQRGEWEGENMSKPTMSNYFVYRPKLLSCISAGKQSADKNKILCGFKITNRGLKICILITWFLFWWESNTFQTCHKSTKIYIFETIHILLPHCKSFADVSTFSVRIMNLLRFKIKFKMWVYNFWVLLSGLAQLVFTKSTMETSEQCEKTAQS